MVLSISVVPEALAAGLDDEPAAGVLLEVVVVELDELAHAATASTAAARLAAVNSFRIRRFSSHRVCLPLVIT
jgi:hypothetical protein